MQSDNIRRGVRFTQLLYCLVSGCEQVDVGLRDIHELYAGKIEAICAFFSSPRLPQTLSFVGQQPG